MLLVDVLVLGDLADMLLIKPFLGARAFLSSGARAIELPNVTCESSAKRIKVGIMAVLWG